MMKEECREEQGHGIATERDWVGKARMSTVMWGVPTAALVAGIFVPPPARTLVWTGALVWKGAACLANARRCGRTHCFFTGPFFLMMAVLVLAHGAGLMSLGPHGWLVLGLVLVTGTGVLWWGSERLFGKYLPI